MYANLPTNDIQNGHLSWSDPQVQAHIQSLVWAEWYEDTEGFLYIVVEDADEWVYGPDNEMADRIAEILRHDRTVYIDEAIDELTHVSYVLRRFTPEDGFYHA